MPQVYPVSKLLLIPRQLGCLAALYSVLGAVTRLVPPGHQSPFIVKPEDSVVDVYVRAAKVILEGTKTLRTLSYVEDKSIRKIHELPSWVPDFSVPDRLGKFQVLEALDVSNSRKSGGFCLVLEGERLKLVGRSVGSVSAL